MLMVIETDEMNASDEPADQTQHEGSGGRPTLREIGRGIPRVAWRTIVKAWDDSIIGWAAQAASSKASINAHSPFFLTRVMVRSEPPLMLVHPRVGPVPTLDTGTRGI